MITFEEFCHKAESIQFHYNGKCEEVVEFASDLLGRMLVSEMLVRIGEVNTLFELHNNYMWLPPSEAKERIDLCKKRIEYVKRKYE